MTKPLPPAISPLAAKKQIVCPCCGTKFTGDMHAGCAACGARAVGPPLTPPAHVLPRIGRASAAFAAGAAFFLTLFVATLAELSSGAGVSFGLWATVSAAETVAWRMKWTLLPAALACSIIGLHHVLRVRVAAGETPFGGRRFAQSGVLMSAGVACAIMILIGVTIPERLRQREAAHEAGIQSLGYATSAVMRRYQNTFGTLPTDLDDLRKLHDTDGNIAYVLANFTGGAYDTTEAYKPSSVQAVARAPRTGRGGVSSRGNARLRPASLRGNTNDSATNGLTFTNYDLVWYGEDKIPGTADDRIIRDGEFVAPVSRLMTPTPASSATPKAAPAKRIKSVTDR